jgi:HlyD family secretion protein
VKTGIVGETEVEVLSGLGDGEEIVSGSYRTLRTLKDQAKIKQETKKERS